MANDRKVGNLLVQMRADLGQLKLDVKEVERTFKSGFDGISSAAKNLAGALGAGLSVGSLIAFGKSVIDLGGKLQDLSEQSGISVTTLSGIKSTLEESGGSLEGFTSALIKAQATLGSTTDESGATAAALKAIGLSLEEAKKLAPEQFLERIAKGLASINDQNTKITAARGLLGRSGAESVPALIAMADQFDRLRAGGLSEGTVKALDDIGDAFTRLKNSIITGAAPALAAFFKQFGLVSRSIEEIDRDLQHTLQFAAGDIGKIITLMNELGEARKRAAAEQEKKIPGGGGLEDLAAQKRTIDQFRQFQESLNKQLFSIRAQQIGLGGGAQASLAFQLDEQLKAFKEKLSADKLKPPAGLDKFFADLKEKILGANNELRQTGELLERIGKDEADAAEARKAIEAAQLAPFKAEDALTLQRMDEAAARAARDFDDMAAATREWGEVALQAFHVGDDLAIKLDQIDKESAVFGTSFDAASAKVAALSEAIRQLIAQGLDPLDPKLQELKAQLDKSLGDQELQQGIKDLAASIGGAFKTTLDGIMQGTQTFGEGMKNLFRNIVLSISNEIFQLSVIKPFAKWLESELASIAGLGGGNSGGGIFASLLGSVFGALLGGGGSGGSVDPGLQWTASGFDGVVRQPTGFIAGEAGAEHVRVTPLSKMGGGFGGNVYNIDARGAQRGVSAEIRSAIQMSENRAVERSVVSVRDQRRRSNIYAHSFGGRS